MALTAARRARGQSIGRPKALDQSKVALAQRMHASGESAGTIASTLGISRATAYRALGGDDPTGT
jgi:DNA invertase Pin-like site-specific DNA recombinase